MSNKWLRINWQECQFRLDNLQFQLTRAFFIKNKLLSRKLQNQIIGSFAAQVLAIRKALDFLDYFPFDNEILFYKFSDRKSRLLEKLKVFNKNVYKFSKLQKNLNLYFSEKNSFLIDFPCILDNAIQILYHFTLLPISEVLSDTCNFGYRLGRNAHDAVFCLKSILNRKKGLFWVLNIKVLHFYFYVSHTWLFENVSIDRFILKKFLEFGFLNDTIFLDQGYQNLFGELTLSNTIKNRVLDGIIFDNSTLINYVRFNDELVFLIYSNSFSLKQNLLRQLQSFFRVRGLSLNNMTCILKKNVKYFDFLGITFENKLRKFSLKPSLKEIKKIFNFFYFFIKKKTQKNFNYVFCYLKMIFFKWTQFYCFYNNWSIFLHIRWLFWRSLIYWIKKNYNKLVYKILKKRLKIKINSLIFIKLRNRNLQLNNYKNIFLYNDKLYFLNRFFTYMGVYFIFKNKWYKLFLKQNGLCLFCYLPISDLERIKIVKKKFKKSNKIIFDLVLIHKKCLAKF